MSCARWMQATAVSRIIVFQLTTEAEINALVNSKELVEVMK